MVSVSTHSCSLRQVCPDPWHLTIVPLISDLRSFHWHPSIIPGCRPVDDRRAQYAANSKASHPLPNIAILASWDDAIPVNARMECGSMTGTLLALFALIDDDNEKDEGVDDGIAPMIFVLLNSNILPRASGRTQSDRKLVTINADLRYRTAS